MRQTYPLIFTFDDTLIGPGFVARLKASGRVLLVQEDDCYWMYGVTPCGIAGGDAERAGAFSAFKRSYLSVLYDIAAEARDEAAFKAEVEAFFYNETPEIEAEWQAARHRVKAGDLDLVAMPRTNTDAFRPRVEVQTAYTPTPASNPADPDLIELADAA